MRRTLVLVVVLGVLVGVTGCLQVQGTLGPGPTPPGPGPTVETPTVETPAAVPGLPEGKMVASKNAVNAVPMAAAPIKADGVLDEPAWKTAVAMTDFVLGRDKSPVQAKVLLTWDKDNLYVAVINDEPMTDKLVTQIKDREGAVWEDDSVEVYVDPENTKAGDNTDYSGFFVSAANVVYDRRQSEAWTAPWTSGTKVIAGKAWVAELAIPWKSLEVTPKVGHKFGLMVARDRKAGGKSEDIYLVPCGEEAKDTSTYPTFELK